MNFNIVKIAKAGHNIEMEPIRLASDEEISAAYDQGKEAVIKLFHQTFGNLAENLVYKTVRFLCFLLDR